MIFFLIFISCCERQNQKLVGGKISHHCTFTYSIHLMLIQLISFQLKNNYLSSISYVSGFVLHIEVF
jgi:hypothetical protein